jgi:hypothetical protein
MRRAAALVAVCVGVLAAGCGGDSGAPAATNVETKAGGTGIPAGFTVRTVKNERFSIALPKKWRSLDARQVLAAGTKDFEKANPELGGQVRALAQPSSPLKLLAIGPGGDGGFVTNLNVIVTQLPSDLEFDEWSSTEVKEIEKVPSVKNVRQEETQLPPGQALHLNYRASFNRANGGTFEVVVHQWMVKKDDFLYILTFTTAPSQEAKERQTFDESAHTFRLTS